MVSMMMQAFLVVTVITAVMMYLVYLGYFDTVHTEVGRQFYAERYSAKWSKVFPPWLNMPYNTFVNLGYIVVGAFYCAKTSVSLHVKQITSSDSVLFYTFNIMATFYGAIQAVRILTQFHRSAVLDQWYTLPFFMWVFVWSSHLDSGIGIKGMVSWMAISLLSYCLTLVHMHGFEIALALHILFAVYGAITIYRKFPIKEAQQPFIWALIFCAGFVFLKLADLELPNLNPMFEKISGHFLSKIADILQIYCVNKYFEILTLYKNSVQNKKSK
ncbi:transmembrane protein 187-like [Saccostrea echinata]|uniref:transmembrane protein 187-like n=1 Tax=Saccostrea echinata TaxID=191078 RepID=UPI002A7F98DE|nr:transmembrane protein 187-like [Saccostrea echinata]